MLASDTEVKLMALTERRRQKLEAERPPPSTLRRRTSGIGRRSSIGTPLPSSARKPSNVDSPAATAAASAASDDGMQQQQPAEATEGTDEVEDFSDEVGSSLAAA